MKRIGIIFSIFLLILIFPNLSWSAKNKEENTSLSFSVKSTASFADVDKNGVIDYQENKTYETKKNKIFDADHNGKLNEAEKQKFEYIDKIICSGGQSLDALNDKDKQLYRKWRSFILSLLEKSEERFKTERKKKQKSIKCYPDKVCDDPQSEFYNTKEGSKVSMQEKASQGHPHVAPSLTDLPSQDITSFQGEVSLQKPMEQFVCKGSINILYAAGLNAAMNQIINEFKKDNPKAKVIRQSGGTSLLLRKITELNQKVDVLFAADAQAIKDNLIPKYTDWFIKFYKDRIVLAYSDRSKYTNEINAQNWFKVLLRKDVRFGYANPDLAPLGYRTLMTWQLADLYYKENIDTKSIYDSLKEVCPKDNIMPDAAEVLHLLESLSLDYAFVYESTAKQHNLKYIQLPKEIDLGSDELGEFYKQAKVEMSGQKRGEKQVISGSPITFALTILKDAPNLKEAVAFVKFFLGPRGQEILKANDQAMLIPCLVYNLASTPDELKQFVLEDAEK